ncbi:phage holin family protein [Rathayibacter sp. AY1F4]|nr:phage holin family protein [Rathayibacter sp. AY2B1]PPG70137.1 phage holin family protein [Rathayibacter sp. AY1F4]
MSHPRGAPVVNERNPKNARSLGELVSDLPGLVIELVKAEVASLKNELAGKAKSAGLAVGLFAVAAFLLLTAWATLVAFAIIGIASWLPAWLSALIVTVFFLLVAVILALVGVRTIKKAVPPVPQDSIDSIKKDVQAFKGVGSYDN